MEHRAFDDKRITHAARTLRKEGFITADQAGIYDERVAIAERTVLDILPLAETAQAPDEKERETRINQARRHRSYLLPYYENATQDELREVMRGNNWSTGQYIDTVASKGLKFYVKMIRLPSEEGATLSPEAVQSQREFSSRTAIDHYHEEQLDLDETIRSLGPAPDRLNRMYAQGLLIVFDKVTSTYDPVAVANTVSLALEDVLRRHKYHFGDADTIVRRFSEHYLYALSAVEEEPNFKRITKHAWQMATKDLLDDGSVLSAFESAIAHQLEAMYPKQAKRT